MFSFLWRRILAGLATLFVATFAMYLLVSASMDPFYDLRQSTSPNKAALIAERINLLDLNTGVVIRYFKWLGNVLHGDLGVAWVSGQTVTNVLQGAILSTIQLVTAATFLAIFFGVAVGIVSALRQYSSFDYLIIFVSFLLYSLPAFWVAVLLKQWGAIGFNDFLADPVISWVAIGIVALLAGILWSLAIGGDMRRRAITFGLGFAATFAMFAFLQITDWWTTPSINPPLLAILGAATAFGITTLSAGLKNRRALGASLTTVVIGLVLYLPIETFFKSVQESWLMMLGLAILTVGVGIGVGYAWGGPDPGVSARTAAMTSIVIASMIFVNQIMRVWPAYYNAPAISGRPIPTIGSSTPNLGGNFWVGRSTRSPTCSCRRWRCC